MLSLFMEYLILDELNMLHGLPLAIFIIQLILTVFNGFLTILKLCLNSVD